MIYKIKMLVESYFDDYEDYDEDILINDKVFYKDIKFATLGDMVYIDKNHNLFVYTNPEYYDIDSKQELLTPIGIVISNENNNLKILYHNRITLDNKWVFTYTYNQAKKAIKLLSKSIGILYSMPYKEDIDLIEENMDLIDSISTRKFLKRLVYWVNFEYNGELLDDYVYAAEYDVPKKTFIKKAKSYLIAIANIKIN